MKKEKEILALKEYLTDNGYGSKDSLKIAWIYYHNGKEAALSFFSNGYDWSDHVMQYSMVGELEEDIEEWETNIHAYPQIKYIRH